MRTRVLVIVVLIASLVLAMGAMLMRHVAGWPGTSRAPVLPTDAPAQVEWLGDIYATSLTASSGEELSADLVAASRQDFTQRVRASLVQPLPAAELWEVADWIFQMNGLSAVWPVPPDLELKDRMGNTAHIIALYLARPRVRAEERHSIRVQVGQLMGYLHGALVKEFPDLAEPDSVIEGAAFVTTPMLWESLLSPVSPELTRLFTPDEVEWLRERARYDAARARQRAATLHQELAAEAGDMRGLAQDTAEAEITGAVLQFHNQLRNLQYTRPTVLTPQEEEANREARRRRWELEFPSEEIHPEGEGQ